MHHNTIKLNLLAIILPSLPPQASNSRAGSGKGSTTEWSQILAPSLQLALASGSYSCFLNSYDVVLEYEVLSEWLSKASLVLNRCLLRCLVFCCRTKQVAAQEVNIAYRLFTARASGRHGVSRHSAITQASVSDYGTYSSTCTCLLLSTLLASILVQAQVEAFPFQGLFSLCHPWYVRSRCVLWNSRISSACLSSEPLPRSQDLCLSCSLQPACGLPQQPAMCIHHHHHY